MDTINLQENDYDTLYSQEWPCYGGLKQIDPFTLTESSLLTFLNDAILRF